MPLKPDFMALTGIAETQRTIFETRSKLGLANLQPAAMARAYSDDLRRKIFEAYAQKEGTQPELAKRFHVSLGT